MADDRERSVLEDTAEFFFAGFEMVKTLIQPYFSSTARFSCLLLEFTFAIMCWVLKPLGLQMNVLKEIFFNSHESAGWPSRKKLPQLAVSPQNPSPHLLEHSWPSDSRCDKPCRACHASAHSVAFSPLCSYNSLSSTPCARVLQVSPNTSASPRSLAENASRGSEQRAYEETADGICTIIKL